MTKDHDKYITFMNNKQDLPDHPFPEGACLILGEPMLAGIDENHLKSRKHKVKIRYFPDACRDDMYDMKLLLQKLPDYINLHIGANDALDRRSRENLDKILKLKTYIQKKLQKSKINISTPIKRQDHGKESLTISHLSKKFKDLKYLLLYNIRDFH